jgi:hypothetical protein
MDQKIASHVVHDVLMQIQAGQKLDCPPLNDEVQPLRDIKKFDSPVSIAATGMIGRKLNIKIPPKINLFGDKNGKYTIAKTISILCKLADEQKKTEAA